MIFKENTKNDRFLALAQLELTKIVQKFTFFYTQSVSEIGFQTTGTHPQKHQNIDSCPKKHPQSDFYTLTYTNPYPSTKNQSETLYARNWESENSKFWRIFHKFWKIHKNQRLMCLKIDIFKIGRINSWFIRKFTN